MEGRCKVGRVWSRVLQTVTVIWALAMVGVSDALLGPSLLDLQALLQVDLGQINYIVLATGLGDFVGAVLSGFIAKSADINLRLTLCAVCGTLSIACAALLAEFIYVLILFSLQGLIRGITFCYSLEKGKDIWRRKGVAFQLFTFGPSIGSVLSPLIVNLFLCTPPSQHRVSLWNSSASNVSFADLNAANVSYVDWNVPNASYAGWNAPDESSGVNSTGTESCNQEDVRIHYAYVILGLICSPTIIFFFIQWLKSENINEGEFDVNDINESAIENIHSNRSNKKFERIFSILFVIYYFTLLGSSIEYTTYLTEFGVKGPLHLDKAQMVLMTSLYWGVSLLGRFMWLIITPCLGVEKLIILALIPLIIFGTVLISSVQTSEVVLWLCTCAIATAIAPLVGAGYAWCSNFISLTPMIISASSASLGLGAMALPFIAGVFFKSFGPMAFLYFFYAGCIFATVLFGALFFVSRRLNKTTNIKIEDPLVEPFTSNDPQDADLHI